MTAEVFDEWFKQVPGKQSLAQMVKWVSYQPEAFEKVVVYFLEKTSRRQKNAAWLFGYTAHLYPEIIKKHWSALCERMQQKGIDAATERNFFRSLQCLKLDDDQSGEAIALCFERLQNPGYSNASRVFALTALVNLVQPYPELKQEVRLCIEAELPFASKAFISRASKELKRL